jgi:hypothetical protein
MEAYALAEKAAVSALGAHGITIDTTTPDNTRNSSVIEKHLPQEEQQQADDANDDEVLTAQQDSSCTQATGDTNDAVEAESSTDDQEADVISVDGLDK